jgi:hypothetical protein
VGWETPKIRGFASGEPQRGARMALLKIKLSVRCDLKPSRPDGGGSTRRGLLQRTDSRRTPCERSMNMTPKSSGKLKLSA